MADQEDIAALLSGDDDLAERDFRSAQLEDINFGERDFTRAHLQGANFSRSNLSNSVFDRADLSQMNASRANLRGIKMRQTAVPSVNFSGADLSDADFNRSHFGQVDFSGATLTGTNFQNCFFNEGTTFIGAISDESTLFDGATIFRPLARDPIFRFYTVKQGKLVKKLPGEAEIARPRATPEIIEALAAIIHTEESIMKAAAAQPNEDRSPGIGHNRPPLDAALTAEDITKVRDSLHALASELRSTAPNQKTVEATRTTLSDSAAKIGRWASKKADTFSDELAKSLGKQAGDLKMWIGLWMIASGHLTSLLEIIGRIWP